MNILYCQFIINKCSIGLKGVFVSSSLLMLFAMLRNVDGS